MCVRAARVGALGPAATLRGRQRGGARQKRVRLERGRVESQPVGRLQVGRRPPAARGVFQKVQVQTIGVVMPSTPTLVLSLLNLVKNLNEVVGATRTNVVIPSTVVSGKMSAGICG